MIALDVNKILKELEIYFPQINGRHNAIYTKEGKMNILVHHKGSSYILGIDDEEIMDIGAIATSVIKSIEEKNA
jgi:GrpB-like predicted nucleotidyltransferase (UPF0157 family)